MHTPGFALVFRPFAAAVVAAAVFAPDPSSAQQAIRFAAATLRPTHEIEFELHATRDLFVRLERSENLTNWTSLQTLQSTGTNHLVVGALPSSPPSFYRALLLSDTDVLTGDHLSTDAGEVLIHPVNHASFVLRWQEIMIYNDPVGGAAPYSALPRADLVLVSHQHGDHFNAGTLDAVRGPNTRIVAPAAVYSSLSATLRALTISLANGESTNVFGLTVEAVPAYNANHPKGAGNGYVLTIGGRRIYMSGDTGAISETRALESIDVAFLSMNIPFTMSVTEATSVARDFRPRILYPYHYRNQNGTFADLEALKRGLGADAGVEVRVRGWY